MEVGVIAMKEERTSGAAFIGLAHGAIMSARALDDTRIEQRLQQLIAERRRRSAHFNANLFSDPAWDILLVLALADTRQQRLTVTKLCRRIDTPMTTALRWIGTLTEQGHVLRRDDVTDKRRKYIELSPGASAAMRHYCTAESPSLALVA